MTEPKPKEPMLALLLSLMCFGLGQVYVGKVLRGVLFLVTLLLGIGLLVIYFVHPETRLSAATIACILVLWIFKIYGWIDSYLVARRYNAAHNFKRERTFLNRTLWIAAIIIFGFIFNPSYVISLRVFSHVRDNYAKPYKTPSEGMSPTIKKNDRFMVDRTIYKKSMPQRGDIIVFQFDAAKDYVKRVVGLPNETVEISEGKVLINGIELNEGPFAGLHYINRTEHEAEGERVLVPADHYYVLGDNSHNSHDSRHGFFVSKDQITGKVYKIFYPFNRSGPVR